MNEAPNTDPNPDHPGPSTPSSEPTADDPIVVPARMLNEFTYCPRLFYLEWVQKEWRSSADTLAGQRDHRQVDQPRGSLPSPDELDPNARALRSLQLESERSGIVAKLDVLELGEDGVVPVDYKHGKAPPGDSGPWDADRIQVGAQARILIDHGYSCDRAVLYYAGSKQRVEIPVDQALLDEVEATVASARTCAESPLPPLPLVDSPKCPRCSLAPICLPDESRQLTDEPSDTEPRLLYPARDDATPLHIQTQGARIGKRGGELVVKTPEDGETTVRLLGVSQVSLFGNIQVSAAALRELLQREIPVCHFSYGGWFQGITHTIGPRNCAARLHQYEASQDPVRSLDISKGFITRKITNARTLLRRNGTSVDPSTLRDLERSAKAAQDADSPEALLGIEGNAARIYFGAFHHMLKQGNTPGETFEFTTRNRRPPKDPINALLSLAYSTLARDWTIALLSVSLDPFLGLFHRPRFGRPALALDLMEEFRPLVADSVVLQLVNNRELDANDFIQRGDAVNLTPTGRKAFFKAYERRMNHLVRHPTFGYRVSYRRLFEVQARLFARHLSGELPTFDGFMTR